MSSRILVAVAATLAFAASLAQADVWRWKDAQNKWHYSDVPVEGAQLIKSSTRVPAPQSSDAEPAGASNAAPPVDRVAASGAAASDRVAAEATARQVQSDIAKKRQEQCKEATARYEKSITARRLFREAKNGERVYLTEAELAQARVDARTDRDTACGSPTR
jgi:Domain of unknown function (DUF4124)